MTDSKPSGVRKGFPILGSGGVKIDWQLVEEHSEQARRNHGQSVSGLAGRGGLAWCELFAVLHNQKWQKIDTNEAMLACRKLEARYLAAIAQPDPVGYALAIEQAAKTIQRRVGVIVDEHGSWEPDTNVTNLPEWAETACEELEGIENAIRALTPPADRLAVVLAMPEVAALVEAGQSMRRQFSPFPSEDTERWREEHEACADMDAALAALVQPNAQAQINWATDPDAIVEDDEPQIGRDYA